MKYFCDEHDALNQEYKEGHHGDDHVEIGDAIDLKSWLVGKEHFDGIMMAYN